MLVVISDLHFEEEESTNIRAGERSILSQGNIGAEAFLAFVDRIEAMAIRNRAREIDLVLAGDIFDLHRTGLWFSDESELRPYVSCGEVASGSALENKLLAILDGIEGAAEVSDSLKAIRALGAGDKPVRTRRHYIPGNHDRLANATPALRRRVRELLAMDEDDSPFPHALLFRDPRVLVRHGHEYDAHNFSKDHDDDEIIPVEYPSVEYAAPAFGDLITVDIASRLPWQFRKYHGDDKILADPKLSAIYGRLLDFDDVRPQAALMNFLLTMPDYSEERIWNAVAPALRDILADLHASPTARSMLRRLPLWQQAIAFNLLERSAAGETIGYLEIKTARWIQKIISLLPRATSDVAVAAAAREQVLRDGEARFVVAGHTHTPQLALIRGEPLEQYYVNTGTWRHRIPADEKANAFGKIKSLTYMIVWASNEDRPSPNGKTESFDYWDGATFRWP